MTQSSCKRDSKSKSHPGMRLAPVRVFSCKHPLTVIALYLMKFIRIIQKNFDQRQLLYEWQSSRSDIDKKQ